ncbi:MAG: hypothetical protein HY316_11460 [Acidobacteria bacterium]|nr:hypothetical protein [Acidobacteriota bacterium]
MKLQKEHRGNFFEILDGLLHKVERKVISYKKLGLCPGETYANPDDAPRTATIFNGFPGKKVCVPVRKGDPEGHRWCSAEPLWINWDQASVCYLQNAPESRWQGYSFFFLPGVTWTLHANHVALKARVQPPCVFDASGSRLTPIGNLLTVNQFLALLSSDLFSYIVKKFVKNTQDYEVNDLRMAPIVVPSRSQAKELESLANCAIKAKELSLKNAEPAAELVTYCRNLVERQQTAPAYLQPRPQILLLHTSEDCLAIIELAVNWAVERLYGVEGLGPFHEF